MRFIPNAKQAKAAQMLHNAYLHLLDDRETYRLAFDILMDAERFVRSGFRMPNWREFYHVDEADCPFMGRK